MSDSQFYMEPPPERALEPETLAEGAAVAADMLKEAEKAGLGRCVMGERVFWWPTRRAYGPGHIYTLEGRSEFRISGACEWHFDKLLMEEDDSDHPNRVLEEVAKRDRSDEDDSSPA